MANVTTCPECGKLYEAGSEEQANEPGRLCPVCFGALVSPPPRICAKCGKPVKHLGRAVQMATGELLCTECYFESDAGRAALAPLNKVLADAAAHLREKKEKS